MPPTNLGVIMYEFKSVKEGHDNKVGKKITEMVKEGWEFVFAYFAVSGALGVTHGQHILIFKREKSL